MAEAPHLIGQEIKGSIGEVSHWVGVGGGGWGGGDLCVVEDARLDPFTDKSLRRHKLPGVEITVPSALWS